jgi:hypothetical protein
MNRILPLALSAFAIVCGSAPANDIKGQYVEARTCDVWTGPCFANAEMNWGGKNAVMAWKVDSGTIDSVRLDGLSVVAVVDARDTLGLDQTGPARALLIVDQRATPKQREALIHLAKKQAGDLATKVIAVESAKVDLRICNCEDGGCAILEAGKARVETRCLNDRHEKVCGNETAFYPPLGKNVEAKAAVAVENTYSGKGFDKTWTEAGRRGAYVGSFTVR